MGCCAICYFVKTLSKTIAFSQLNGIIDLSNEREVKENGDYIYSRS